MPDDEKGPEPKKELSCPCGGEVVNVDGTFMCDNCKRLIQCPPRAKPTRPPWNVVAEEYGPFEHEVMRYLRNLANKCNQMHRGMLRQQEALEILQSTMLSFGQANGTAYKQLKEVVNSLGASTKRVVDDLSDCMGNIRFLDWDTYGDVPMDGDA